MNSRQLELFVKVAELGSLSRASVMLNTSQPMLSRQLRLLEEELQTQLFHRTGRGVVLTPSGGRLLQRANRILDEISEAKRELLDAGPAQLSELVVAMPTTVGRILTSPLAKELIARYPQIRLRILEGVSGHILEWITDGRVDIAILYDTVQLAQLKVEQLCRERLYVIGSADSALPDAIPVRDLPYLPLILPGRPHGLRLLMDMVAAQSKIRLQIRVEADAFSTIRQLVADGVGYAVLPLAPVQGEIASGRFRICALTDPEVTRQLVLAAASTRVPTEGLRQVARLIKGLIAGLVGAATPLAVPRLAD